MKFKNSSKITTNSKILLNNFQHIRKFQYYELQLEILLGKKKVLNFEICGCQGLKEKSKISQGRNSPNFYNMNSLNFKKQTGLSVLAHEFNSFTLSPRGANRANTSGTTHGKLGTAVLVANPALPVNFRQVYLSRRSLWGPPRPNILARSAGHPTGEVLF